MERSVEKGKGKKGPELWRGEGEKWFLLSTMAGADGDAAGVAGVEMAWQIGNVVHWFTRVRLINTIFPKPRTTISGLIQTKRQ